ncbi:carboxy terminal-processing peptidase [Opitutales bacterium ASA1]|uniref:carboxy terminal-processing peptidase n=1 Tax=Congregicoccus parvus TaxID=3081749 RepID=UPI002B2C7321|nr:carboxy terminal-processing peptidase [Opitutales bacterium ASA1]
MQASLAAAGSVAGFNTLPLEHRRGIQQEVRTIIGLLESHHYRNRPFVQTPTSALIDSYLGTLDGQRMFFLRGDVAFVQRRFGRNLMSSYLLSGDIHPAFEIVDLFRERFEARMDWVSERLGRPLDVNRRDTWRDDRSQADWPNDESEADALWERKLTDELIEGLLVDSDVAWATACLRERYEQRRRRFASIDAEVVQELFLASVLSVHDPHSGYDSVQSLLDRGMETTGSAAGVGIELVRSEGAVVIEALVPGGAAEASGEVSAGDRIVALVDDDGAPVEAAGLSLREIVRRIRGEPGTTVRFLSVVRDGETPREIALVRATIEPAEQHVSALLYEVPDGEATRRVGAIRLPVFYGGSDGPGSARGAGAGVRASLEELLRRGAEAIVLDLRDNPGGLTTEAALVAGLFLDRGPVMFTRGSDGKTRRVEDEVPGALHRGPLVVLTSARSASASEVVAGALQAYRRAVVSGDAATFGKGTAQAVVDLDAVKSPAAASAAHVRGGLRLTSQRFYLPDGRSPQIDGVLADIVLPSSGSRELRRERDLPRAFPNSTIDVPEFAQFAAVAMDGIAPVTDARLQELTRRSESRVAQSAEFAGVREARRWWEERRSASERILQLDTRRAERSATTTEMGMLRDEGRRTMSETGLRATHVSVAPETAKSEAHGWRAGVYRRAATDTAASVELRAGDVDPNLFLGHADALANAFARASGVKLEASMLRRLVFEGRRFEGEFEPGIERRLAVVLGMGASDERMKTGLSALFEELVELEPELVDPAVRFDPGLREAVRIAADWLQLGESQPPPETASAIATGEVPPNP